MAKIPDYNKIDYKNDSKLVINAKQKAIAKAESAEKAKSTVQSATQKARNSVSQATAKAQQTAKNQANKAVQTATDKAKAVGGAKVAEAKAKVDNVKAQADKMKSKAQSLLNGGGMALLQNGCLSALMGKISSTPAMSVISKMAGLATMVNGVKMLTETMKKAKLKRNKPQDNVEEQNGKINDGEKAKTNETLAGETGAKQEEIPATKPSLNDLKSNTAQIASVSTIAQKSSIPSSIQSANLGQGLSLVTGNFAKRASQASSLLGKAKSAVGSKNELAEQFKQIANTSKITNATHDVNGQMMKNLDAVTSKQKEMQKTADSAAASATGAGGAL